MKKLTDFNYAEKTNWTNKEIVYLKNVRITEYDIKSAGLSVIKFRKLISEKEILKLEAMDKHKRTVKEGLLQKSNPKIAEEIIDTLGKARKAFVYINDIYEEDVLSIKKDAIFVINIIPKQTIIKDYFNFRKKNIYTSYINLNGKEFYYNSNEDKLDVKGLPEESKLLQENFFLNDIKKFLKINEKINQEGIYKLLKSYREKYLNRELPIDTYRELSNGKFRVGNYLLDNIDPEMLSVIDITQNYLNYFIPLCEAIL